MSTPVSRFHRVYGLELETDFDFAARLPDGVGPAHVTFFHASERERDSIRRARPLWASDLKNPQGESLVRLYKDETREILIFSNAADFFIDGTSVGYRVHSATAEGRMESSFLASVLAFLLERRGVLALHASAVSRGSEAVAFMAASGTGKSTLAAAFLMRGWSLVTDDVLAVDLKERTTSARPGYPEIKLGPSIGQRALGSSFDECSLIESGSRKRRVVVGEGGFGNFRSTDCTLKRIYVLSRRSGVEEAEVSRSSVTGRDAVKELLRYSFTPRLAQATGMAGERLSRLVELSQRLQVIHIGVPSDLERLGDVVAAVELDLESA